MVSARGLCRGLFSWAVLGLSGARAVSCCPSRRQLSALQCHRAEMPGLTTQLKTGTCREVSGRIASLAGCLGEPSISSFGRHVSWILSPSLYVSLFSFGKN